MSFRFRIGAMSALMVGAVVSIADAAQISIDVAQDRIAVSPYLYGKNGCLSDNPQNPLSAADWQRLRDAGVRMVREHGGNNGTKYNWQKKLTSHPDWYNNVYAHDWDFAQTSLQQNLPGVQCMWCFQLIGRVADNTQHNFDDWSFNRSQSWGNGAGPEQNLAGGGTPNLSGGSKAAKEGDPSLYLTNTDATTSTAILDHFTNDLHLDRNQFRYWNMDNEPEIWNGTHDDVMPVQLSAEDFMQRYFAYATAARARYPDIKLVGPVTANEWQWYNWATPITSGGRTYPWLEYFIKRIGEEEARTGVRLLDVLDLHYYPGASNPADIVQLHRTFFDTTYVNPDANGVHAVNGGWDTSITQEYIFGRCQQWLTQYLGANHGVTFGLTEAGTANTTAPIASVWYASTLGEFMKHGVEIFTPWTWQTGMWEVLHLYSRYNYATSVRTQSDDETNVSAYATVDDQTGNVTVVLVNRALSASKAAAVALANAGMPDGKYDTLQLSNLPATETFVSHTQNALVLGTVNVAGQQFSVTLPPLSITSVLLRKPAPTLPVFALQPTAQTMAAGSTVVFNVAVGDATGVAYQWKHNGVAIAGGTTATLLIDEASTADAGTYSATATNSAGSTASNSVTLSVVDAAAANTGRLGNLSVRTFSGTSDQVLNVGFAVGGDGTSGAKPLLMRAIGPTLTTFGLAGTMTDPMLKVQPLGSTTVVAANDDWGGDTAIVSTSNAVGAFAIGDPHSADAALLTSVAGGVYTAIAAGKNNGTGIVITEIYDATPRTSFTSSTPRLINVSARAQAGTGDNALIVGFSIVGSTSATVLIRATGPALAAFGVSGTIPDPALQVYQLGGPKLYENDNWGGADTLRTVSNRVNAFSIADGASKDSALLVTLPPGTYTAQVTAAGTATGIALVEVYEVP